MSDKLDLRRIATEQRNPRTAHIDELPTIDMVRLINSEDKKVAEAVELVCPQIAELGEQELRDAGFGAKDVLVGIAASGRTPYVLGAMEYARSIGAAVIGLTCCPGSEIDRIADVGIAPAPGPEVITGSTRMKSGTAQKMVLNMLSTGTMIKLGKVYGNLMVDVKPSNEKLVRRCVTIVCEATGVGEDEAVAALEKCGYVCKQAIVMLLRGVDAPRAAEMLNAAGGRVAAALEEK